MEAKDIVSDLARIEKLSNAYSSDIGNAEAKGLKVTAVEIPVETLFHWQRTVSEARWRLEEHAEGTAAKLVAKASDGE